MKVALVNFSPRGNGSNSRVFERYVHQKVGANAQTVELDIRNSAPHKDISVLDECEVWVFFYPLYIDALPSHMLSFIAELERSTFFAHSKRLYAVANCGFYEGEQTRLSFEILNNWCLKSGAKWCGGVGIGASGCIEFFERFGVTEGPRIFINRALDFLADNIIDGSSQCNNYVTVALPKRFYKAAGEILWRQKIISYGGKISDLSKIP